MTGLLVVAGPGDAYISLLLTSDREQQTACCSTAGAVSSCSSRPDGLLVTLPHWVPVEKTAGVKSSSFVCQPGHPGLCTARLFSPHTTDLPDSEMKPREGASEIVWNCWANIVLQINNQTQAKYLLSNKGSKYVRIVLQSQEYQTVE